MEENITKKLTLEEASKKFRDRLKKMSQEEILQTFVSAGILTEKGNVRKPYRDAIVPQRKALAAK